MTADGPLYAVYNDRPIEPPNQFRGMGSIFGNVCFDLRRLEIACGRISQSALAPKEHEG